MGRFDGQVVVVTGAAGGIGRAAATAFAAEGARLWLMDREAGPLADVAAPFGDRAGFTAGDIADEAVVAQAVAAAEARFGGVDVMFANAGTEGEMSPLTAMSVERFDRVLAVNVRGAFLSIKHAAPALARRGGGSIVVTSSIAGFIGSPGLGAYVASKHAVNGLVKTAAAELAAAGIRVNAVNPGPIDNRMMRSIEEQAAPGAAAQVRAGFAGRVPMRRYGTNEEIARVVLFLAGPDSGYCTGATFVADGGFLVG